MSDYKSCCALSDVAVYFEGCIVEGGEFGHWADLPQGYVAGDEHRGLKIDYGIIRLDDQEYYNIRDSSRGKFTGYTLRFIYSGLDLPSQGDRIVETWNGFVVTEYSNADSGGVITLGGYIGHVEYNVIPAA